MNARPATDVVQPSTARERCTHERLLISVDWFAPAVRAGGPVRSVVNLVTLIGDVAKISVMTSDLDLGATKPHGDVSSDRWATWKNCASVLYGSSLLRRCAGFVHTIRRHQPACVYLNSMFSPAATLWPLLWLKLFRPRIRVVLAPRGMLKPSALNQKRWKKMPLLFLLHHCRLVKSVVFHATSDAEIEEIRNVFGDVQTVHLSNVPTIPDRCLASHRKEAGRVRLCFLGRIHPVKNLLWLLRVMPQLQVRCHLDLVGPSEDAAYERQCRQLIGDLPEHITVRFLGTQSESEVRQHLMTADAMILPTIGENFGHAIFEAMAVGTPVIISDQTIWRGLEAVQAGWDLGLDNPSDFLAAITKVAAMEAQELDCWRQGALNLAQSFVKDANPVAGYSALFALSKADSGSRFAGSASNAT